MVKVLEIRGVPKIWRVSRCGDGFCPLNIDGAFCALDNADLPFPSMLDMGDGEFPQNCPLPNMIN